MPDFGIFRGFGSKLFSDKLYAGQLPTQLGLIGSEIIGIDTDAQAFFDRVTTAGGTLSDTEKLAIDTLVKQMKTDGIWTKMKAIYPMVGASSAACSQNLKSSSFTGTFTSGWTFASTGAKPNGTSAYMQTNLNNLTMTQNSITFCVYVRDLNTFGGKNDLGLYKTPPGTFGHALYTQLSSTSFGSYNQGEFTQITTASNQLGFFLSKRTNSSQIVLQVNSAQSTHSNSSVSYIDSNFVLARTGELSAEYSSRENAFTGIGDGLTDTEAGNFYTAVQAFQTTLGRQV